MNLSNTNLPFCIFVAGGFLTLLILPFDQLFLSLSFTEFESHHLGDTLKNLLIILVGWLLIRRFGYTKISGVTGIRPRNAYLIFIPLYFILIGPLQYVLLDYQFQSIHIHHVIILFVAMLSVGLSEEFIFRGFIMPHLIKGSNPRESLIVPIGLAAALFGVLHFLNLLQPDPFLPTVLAQVTYATMFGVAFGILLLRTGTIYPIGFIHGIINFSSNLDDLPGVMAPPDLDQFRMYDAIIAIVIVVPYFLYMVRQMPNLNREYLLSQMDDG